MSETATVTVLFTDVVGSTSLRQHQGETAAQAIINAHNEIVRQQIGEHAGQEVKTTGDSFMVAFDSARKAVECAVGIQRALHGYNRRHPVHPVKSASGCIPARRSATATICSERASMPPLASRPGPTESRSWFRIS